MADISKITLPSGTTYNIKDAEARSQIAALTGGDAIIFMGVSTTELTDGGSESPTIDGDAVTPAVGQLYFYQTQEFVWGPDDKWHALGDNLNVLGDLAYKDSASGAYTPAGSVSTPTFTGDTVSVTVTAAANNNGNYQPSGTISGVNFTGATMNSTGKFTPAGSVTVSTNTTSATTATVSTTTGTATYTPAGSVAAPTISLKTAGSTSTVNSITDVGALPALTTTVANETLTIGWNAGTLPTKGNNLTVKTGDAAYEASAPNFSGTGVRLVTGNIAIPATYTASFSGTEGNVSVSGTTTGSVSNGTFTGDKVQLSGSTKATGTISQPTFTGTGATITVN